MVAIFTFKNIYRHSLGNIKTMIQIWKEVRGGFQLYISLILSAACTAAKNVFWWRGKDFPLFLLRHICYWWAWPGFAERWDESQTPTSVTQHLLSVCLPSVRACVKHGVIKYLVWDFFYFLCHGTFWSKSLFEGCEFPLSMPDILTPSLLFSM